MMKIAKLATLIVVTSTLVSGGAVAASAEPVGDSPGLPTVPTDVDTGSSGTGSIYHELDEHTTIVEPPSDGVDFLGWPGLPALPGHTPAEGSVFGHGSGGDKGGDKSTGGGKKGSAKNVYVNPRLGLADRPRDVQLQVFRAGADADSFDTVTIAKTKDFSLDVHRDRSDFPLHIEDPSHNTQKQTPVHRRPGR